MLLKTSLSNGQANWTFANDGGAIGTYATGLIIPENSLITQMLWIGNILTPPATTTMSIGWRTVNFAPVAQDPIAFQPAILASAFVGFKSVTGITYAQPYGLAPAVEVIVSIGVAPILVDAVVPFNLTIYVTYINQD